MPFFTQTISFIGHSLGCQVIKTCLKKLHKLGVNDLVENVTMLSGAASPFDKDEKIEELWAKIFSQTVNGVIRNIHTPEDWTLLSFKVQVDRWAIGRQTTFNSRQSFGQNYLNKSLSKLDDTQETDQSPEHIFSLKNYNISELPNMVQGENKGTIGHCDYM